MKTLSEGVIKLSRLQASAQPAHRSWSFFAETFRHRLRHVPWR